MRKYVITPKLSTPYHSQTSGQVDVSNRQNKLILKKTVSQNQKDWSTKIVDTLSAYRIAFKMILDTSYRLVFGNACTCLLNLSTRPYGQDLDKDGDLWKLQISKFEELRSEAYENAKITKNRDKVFHYKFVIRKTFVPEQKIILYNSRLFSGKFKSRWTWSFIVRTVFPHGAVEIETLRTVMNSRLMVNTLNHFWNRW